MHDTIIFNGIWVSTAATLVFFLQGKQARRERDEQMYKEQGEMGTRTVMLPPSQESEEEK